MRRNWSRQVAASVVTGATTPNRNGAGVLVIVASPRCGPRRWRIPTRTTNEYRRIRQLDDQRFSAERVGGDPGARVGAGASRCGGRWVGGVTGVSSAAGVAGAAALRESCLD